MKKALALAMMLATLCACGSNPEPASSVGVDESHMPVPIPSKPDIEVVVKVDPVVNDDGSINLTVTNGSDTPIAIATNKSIVNDYVCFIDVQMEVPAGETVTHTTPAIEGNIGGAIKEIDFEFGVYSVDEGSYLRKVDLPVIDMQSDGEFTPYSGDMVVSNEYVQVEMLSDNKLLIRNLTGRSIGVDTLEGDTYIFETIYPDTSVVKNYNAPATTTKYLVTDWNTLDVLCEFTLFE